MPSRHDLASVREIVPISRTAMMIGYLAAVTAIVLIEACDFITEPLLDLAVPSFEFAVVPTALFFAGLICLGLCCAAVRSPRPFPLLGAGVAYLTAAHAMSALVLAVFAAWFDFTARSGGYRMPDFSPNRLVAFFAAHPVDSAFSLGFWALLTPLAVIVLLPLALLTPGWRRRGTDLSQRLALLILATAAPVAAFVLGSMLAEARFPQGEIDPGSLVFTLLPVTVQGALSAYVVIRLFLSTSPPKRDSLPSRKIDLDKILSSASQLTVVILVLLFLCISQIAGYASRVSELIEARKAFALDILIADLPDESVLSASATDGATTYRWTLVPAVSWATITIAKYDADQDPKNPKAPPWYRVEVTQTLNNENWSIRSHRLTNFHGSRTLDVADRYGVDYKASDTPITVYPKIEAQMRAKEAAFPGVGLSLDLTSFTLVAPFVVFAALVLLSERARSALDHFSRPDDPWILIDGRVGFPGVLARLWLAALAFGPWILAVVTIQTVALLLRTKGDFETLAVDGVASAYVAAVLLLLLIPTCSAVKRLLQLRALARSGR
jgi:hypothetical protein